jgi:hypothetical protein
MNFLPIKEPGMAENRVGERSGPMELAQEGLEESKVALAGRRLDIEPFACGVDVLAERVLSFGRFTKMFD